MKQGPHLSCQVIIVPSWLALWTVGGVIGDQRGHDSRAYPACPCIACAMGEGSFLVAGPASVRCAGDETASNAFGRATLTCEFPVFPLFSLVVVKREICTRWYGYLGCQCEDIVALWELLESGYHVWLTGVVTEACDCACLSGIHYPTTREVPWGRISCCPCYPHLIHGSVLGLVVELAEGGCVAVNEFSSIYGNQLSLLDRIERSGRFVPSVSGVYLHRREVQSLDLVRDRRGRLLSHPLGRSPRCLPAPVKVLPECSIFPVHWDPGGCPGPVRFASEFCRADCHELKLWIQVIQNGECDRVCAGHIE